MRAHRSRGTLDTHRPAAQPTVHRRRASHDGARAPRDSDQSTMATRPPTDDRATHSTPAAPGTNFRCASPCTREFCVPVREPARVPHVDDPLWHDEAPGTGAPLVSGEESTPHRRRVRRHRPTAARCRWWDSFGLPHMPRSSVVTCLRPAPARFGSARPARGGCESSSPMKYIHLDIFQQREGLY